MVTGPGNVYVAAAKRLLRAVIGTESEAGPTEIAIIADHTADPEFVAADLIAQAEHDPLAACLLVTTDPALADQVDKALGPQLAATRHAGRAARRWPGSPPPCWWTISTRRLRSATPGRRSTSRSRPRTGPAGPRDATRETSSWARTRRCHSGTIWPGRTMCCPPGAPPGIPAGLSTLSFLRGIHVVECNRGALAGAAADILRSAAPRIWPRMCPP